MALETIQGAPFETPRQCSVGAPALPPSTPSFSSGMSWLPIAVPRQKKCSYMETEFVLLTVTCPSGNLYTWPFAVPKFNLFRMPTARITGIFIICKMFLMEVPMCLMEGDSRNFMVSVRMTKREWKFPDWVEISDQFFPRAVAIPRGNGKWLLHRSTPPDKPPRTF